MASPTRPRERQAPQAAAARTPRQAARARRLPMAAGNVIVVLVVVAIVGSLLNAAGIRKTANGQDVGFRRDIARFFAEPLYDVSHALRLDQFRRGVQAVSGRRGDDDINASIPDPTTPTDTTTPADPTIPADPTTPTDTTTPAEPVAPKKRAFSPEKPLNVWVGGDSLSITPGESFVNIAPNTEVIGVINNAVDGHVATGLARPEVYNWPQRMAEVIAADDPDAVVLTLGSNDDQYLTGVGGVGPYASAAWMTEYRRRVGGTMDAITGNDDRVLYWVGVPVLRTRSEDRYNPINDIIREEAARRPGRVVYIDLDSRFRGPDGGYVDFIGDVQVRTPDGIHFSRSGGDQVAEIVLAAMNQTFDLTSWRDKIPAADVSPTTVSGGTTPTSTAPKPSTTKKK